MNWTFTSPNDPGVYWNRHVTITSKGIIVETRLIEINESQRPVILSQYQKDKILTQNPIIEEGHVVIEYFSDIPIRMPRKMVFDALMDAYEEDLGFKEVELRNSEVNACREEIKLAAERYSKKVVDSTTNDA